MKAALIPPKGMYATALMSSYHLVLAQIDQEDYLRTYRDAQSSHFIILDNGAAEGEAVTNDRLIRQAFEVGANEIVLPDVMRDWEGTVDSVKSFVDYYRSLNLKRIQMMAVVQSTGDRGSEIACIEAFAKIPEVTTLGIPRHLLEYDQYGRYQLCSWIRGYGYDRRFQVHLLGTNTRYPSEIATIAATHPWVRGVDTSMPYNYAIAGIELGPTTRNVTRPDEYFTRNWFDDIDKTLLVRNIQTYMEWAHAEGSVR